MEIEQALTRLIEVTRRLNRKLVIEMIGRGDGCWAIEFTLEGWRTFIWMSGDVHADRLLEIIEGDITDNTQSASWLCGLIEGKQRNEAGELV